MYSLALNGTPIRHKEDAVHKGRQCKTENEIECSRHISSELAEV